LAKSKVIEESAYHSRSYSYKRKKEASQQQWSKEETLKFYKCLMNFGTDFSMIQQYCPNRTRTQIKRKYLIEEKRNLQLVNFALTNTTHFDSASIEYMLENDKTKGKVFEKLDKSADPEVSHKKIDRRLRKNVIWISYRKMIMSSYYFEEETEIKNKRKRSTEIITAQKLKKELANMPSVKNKCNTPSSSEIVTNKESLKQDIDENKDGKPKV